MELRSVAHNPQSERPNEGEPHTARQTRLPGWQTLLHAQRERLLLEPVVPARGKNRHLVAAWRHADVLVEERIAREAIQLPHLLRAVHPDLHLAHRHLPRSANMKRHRR